MLPLSSWTISLVAIALSGVDARPVDTNITSIPTANNSSSKISNLTNVTAAAQSCTDIKRCRTMDQIVVSCLVTILACVWFVVHRNVPAPKQEPYRHGNVFMKTVRRAWDLILDQRESAIVFVVALLAPEWILAWALRQAIVARGLVRKLKQARWEAIEARHQRCSTVSHLERDAEEVAGSSDDPSSLDKSAARHTDNKPIRLVNRHPTGTRRAVDRCEECVAQGSQCDQFAAAQSVTKADQCWGMSHAFLAIMGGFLFYDSHGPLHPLSPDDVVALVRRGHLVPPTAEEISNQSKGDALSKGVAIIQTLWFVMQCIVRRAEDLPVTSLEIMTLAYTVMTVAMYIVWWHKPLNVSCAVRVPVEDVGNSKAYSYDSIWDRIGSYVMGNQDYYVDLSKCKRVPTFWAGNAEDDVAIADMIALFVAMVFGAVHCMAWNSEFQTHLELQLWRSSAIAIITVPVALAVVAIVAEGIDFDLIIGALYTLIAIIYVAARLILIIMSFTSLSALHAGAYQTIQWTTFIPHI